MIASVEHLLKDSGLRYVKEVEPGEPERFSVPFDLSGGPLVVRVHSLADMICADCFLCRLDSLGLVTGTKELLLNLLRLNSSLDYARVFVYTSPEDEIDWIAVTACVPLDLVTPTSAGQVILATASLAERAMQVIHHHTGTRQEQLE